MRNSVNIFGRSYDVSESYIRLITVVFVVALLARGVVIFRGFAIDDYQFTAGVNALDMWQLVWMGRPILAGIVWLVDLLGANINDLYFSLGIATLLLQAVFVVTILRFVGMEDSPSAGLVGAIMIAHPYLTEATTFREALPGYCVALVLAISALELTMKNPATWRTRGFALLVTLAMLLTYQAFLNYFAVASIFAYFFSATNYERNPSGTNPKLYANRAILLAVICAIATAAFLLIIKGSSHLAALLAGFEVSTPRSQLISIGELPDRAREITTTLLRIYWDGEPVFPDFLKTLVAMLLAVSLVTILGHSYMNASNNRRIRSVLFTSLALVLLVPVSIGVILPFKDWWPMPRVLAHMSIVLGLLFLAADRYVIESNSRLLGLAISLGRWIVLVGFVFLSNQIMTDQQRINQWDRMLANRIVSRLELQPNFDQVAYVYVHGDPIAFPSKLRAAQGDMNISALRPGYSRIPLLNEVSGYSFKKAEGARAVVGDNYCASRRSWPYAEATTIEGDLAVVCFEKRNDANRGKLLIDAAWKGDQDLVVRYLDELADPNYVSVASASLTPLTAAVSQKHRAIAMLLLDRGANPNLIPVSGTSALIEAVWQGDVILVNKLVAKGADVNYRRPSDKITALIIAKAHNKKEIVRLLLDAGALD